MPNTRTANAVRLEFAPRSLVQSNLSDAAFTGDWLWVAGDEACGLDRLCRLDPVGLEQLGVQPQMRPESGPAGGRITAVMLRPIGTLSMIRLMLHGAMGTIGKAQSVERFEFDHMVVKPTLAQGRRGVKVAFDGEVTKMRVPLDFRVLAKPLYLLMPGPHDTAIDTAVDPDGPVG